jgi:hypothetical protein
MYNTSFIVKYNYIQEELLEKNKKTSEYDDQDILDVCDKLYRDELCSVFYADDILDDKIDQGYKFVYNKMILNEQFNSIISEMNNILRKINITDDFSKEESEQYVENDNYEFFILLTLFSKDMFYLTHKCICQQFTLGTIDNDLLSQLLEKSRQILSDKQI